MLFRLRRLAAALSGALLLQLVLLGSGTLCGMRGGVAAGGGVAHGMGGMHEMQGGAPSPASTTVADPATDTGSHQCDAPATGEGCGLPWSPGSCAAMTSCAAVAAPFVAVAQGTISAGAPALPIPATLSSRPAAAPELPPPRT